MDTQQQAYIVEASTVSQAVMPSDQQVVVQLKRAASWPEVLALTREKITTKSTRTVGSRYRMAVSVHQRPRAAFQFADEMLRMAMKKVSIGNKHVML
jgi:hypothetical protein